MRGTLLFFFIALAIGALGSSWVQPGLCATGDVSSPITVSLEVSPVPLLGQSFRIDCAVRTSIAVDGVMLLIILPEGAIKEAGNLSWQGSLDPAIEHTLSVNARFVRTGNLTVRAIAQRPFENGDIWGDVAELTVFVGEHERSLGFKYARGFERGRLVPSRSGRSSSRARPARPRSIRGASPCSPESPSRNEALSLQSDCPTSQEHRDA